MKMGTLGPEPATVEAASDPLEEDLAAESPSPLLESAATTRAGENSPPVEVPVEELMESVSICEGEEVSAVPPVVVGGAA